MTLSLNRREISVAASVLAISVAMLVLAPRFFTLENQTDLLLANIPVLIVAVGMTLVILAGQIDISVGSQFAVCAVIMGALAKAGVPMIAAAALTALLGGVMGALNGSLVAYLRIPSIVVTLAAMIALRDTLRWITQGAWIQDLPEKFQWFGMTQLGSGAITVGVAIAILGIAAWVLGHAAAGRAVYATGSDANAAVLAGIDPARITFWVFTITGMLTACAAVLNSVRFNQVPSNGGIGLEMKVIAAVVVGGTSITGGRGTLLGTALGVALLGIIGPALTFLSVSPYWERAIQGGIILAAVVADGIRIRSRRPSHRVAVHA